MSADVIQIAASQDGTTESPYGSNKVKYNTWYYGSAVSGAAYKWCMVYISWVFAQAGLLALIGGKQASTVEAADWFKAHKQWGTAARVKAIAFYNLGSGGIKHVGLVAKTYANGSIDAWEGNTSSDDAGDQSNGGGVFLRHRPASYIVGFGYPDYPAEPTLHLGPAVMTASVKVRPYSDLTGTPGVPAAKTGKVTIIDLSAKGAKIAWGAGVGWVPRGDVKNV